MKTMRVLLAVLIGVTFGFASAPENPTAKNVDWTKAEQNYKEALKSNNNGVKVSAANYIRKYKLAGTLEELKLLLAKENIESVKMAGALALVSVGSNEGKMAVQNALATEENEIVAEFYKTILNNQVVAQN